MQTASGKVVSGRIEVDAELPEGASVTVLAVEDDETFEADAETERIPLFAGVRRLHLARIRYHLYYGVATNPDRVEVLALWHSSRGSAPALMCGV